jgi:hypothetical protein
VFDVLWHHDHERTVTHALDKAVGVIGVSLLASKIAELSVSPLKGLGGALGALLPSRAPARARRDDVPVKASLSLTPPALASPTGPA